MSKVECSARGIECRCPDDRCVTAQPAPVPMIQFSPRFQAAIIFFVAALIVIPVAFAALARADEAYRRQQLDQQEQTWTR